MIYLKDDKLVEKLDFIQATLEEVITQANSMGDHNIDIPMIEQCFVHIKDIRKPYIRLTIREEQLTHFVRQSTLGGGE